MADIKQQESKSAELGNTLASAYKSFFADARPLSDILEGGGGASASDARGVIQRVSAWRLVTSAARRGNIVVERLRLDVRLAKAEVDRSSSVVQAATWMGLQDERANADLQRAIAVYKTLMIDYVHSVQVYMMAEFAHLLEMARELAPKRDQPVDMSDVETKVMIQLPRQNLPVLGDSDVFAVDIPPSGDVDMTDLPSAAPRRSKRLAERKEHHDSERAAKRHKPSA